MTEEIKKLSDMISKSSRIVFFGGAGVSTESGIPDFRSEDGLYHQQWAYPPEVIISRSFFNQNPAEFFRFYREKLLITHVSPNQAHHALSKLEAMGKLTAVITQNIDGLHQKAGSKNVIELHGSIERNYCMSCAAPYTAEEAFTAADPVPHCYKTGGCMGIIKPDVVLYEESLNQQLILKAQQAVAEADMLIVGGTSLSVYPSAGMIDLFSGRYAVLINKTETPRDRYMQLVIRGGIGSVLSQALAACCG